MKTNNIDLPITNKADDGYSYENLYFFYSKDDKQLYYSLVRYLNEKGSFKIVETNNFIYICNRFSSNKCKYYFDIKDFIEDNPHSGIELVLNKKDINAINIIYYILYYLKYPFIEKILKSKLKYLVYSLIDQEENNFDMYYDTQRIEFYFENCFKDGRNINEITSLNKNDWKKLAEAKLDIKMWYSLYPHLRRHNFNLEEILFLKSIWNQSERDFINICYLLDYKLNDKYIYKLKTLRNYIQKCTIKFNRNFSSILNILIDYINISNRLNIEFDVYPNNLIESHNYVSELSFIEDKKDLEILDQSINKRAQYLDKYTYSDDRLKVIVPKSIEDFESESTQNNNCVKHYIYEFVDEESNIYFIRKIDNPDSSYITIELDENNESVIQAMYYGNQEVMIERYFDPFTNRKEDIEFIDKWLENNKRTNQS